MNITTINFDGKDVKALKELENYNVLEGNIGNKYELYYNNKSYIDIPFQCCFPTNLHESDIHLIDLNDNYGEWYDDLEIVNFETYHSYRCYSPQTSLDERPDALRKFKDKLSSSQRRKILIIFQDTNTFQKYQMINSQEGKANFEFDLYDFIGGIKAFREKIEGKEIDILETSSIMSAFLKKYKNEFHYSTFFYDDYHESITPLLINKEGHVVSFYKKETNIDIFIFPQVESKIQFIDEFLSQVAPNYAPEIFPNSSNNIWTNDERYYLPNHSNILSKKEEIEQKYLVELEKVDKELQENQKKFNFLHELLTKDDDSLVKATIKFLEWLEFETVIDAQLFPM
jgi:hypothetical protein